MKRKFPRIKKRVLIVGILLLFVIISCSAYYLHLIPSAATLSHALEPRAVAVAIPLIGGTSASLSTPLEKPLVADFFGSPADLYTPLTIRFFDMSRGEPSSDIWDFGDNSTSITKNPVHEYAAAGTYDVTLTVKRQDSARRVLTQKTTVGGGDSQEKTILLDTLRQGLLKKGSYVSFVSGRDDSMVTIGGQRVSLPAGSIVKLRTNTDCSGTVTIRSGNLLAFGVPDATLFVNGAQAGTGVSGDCYVAGPANTRANLSFGIIPVMGDIRQMVVDGQETQRGPQNSRIDLSLDTTDIRGDLTLVGYPAFYEGKVDSFSYSSALIADFAVGPPNEGAAPFNVSFRDLSAGTRANDTTWSWDFGDGSTSEEQNPVHQYRNPGSYPISLTVHSGDQMDSQTEPNAVIATPPDIVADFNATPLSGPAPLTVKFTDLSTGSPWIWSWSVAPDHLGTDSMITDSAGNIISNDTVIHDQNPVLTFNDPGVYSVWLTVNTIYGSSDKVRNGYITVTDPYMLPLQDIVAKTGKRGVIRKDSNIRFTVGNSPATIGMNGGFREIPQGAVVKIVAQSDQSGDIHIDSGKLLKFSFPDMALYINGDLIAEGRVDSIYIPYMSDFKTALTYYLPPESARTFFSIDGYPILTDLDNAWIRIDSLGMNERGSLSLISSDNLTDIDGAANQTVHDWVIAGLSSTKESTGSTDVTTTPA